MTLLVVPLLVPGAFAGYGDPIDGYPSHEERLLHLWTNAARAAPDAFTDDYEAGGCSTADFSDDELTPKPALYLDRDLLEVARFHSTDMKENGCFQHESCDGTDTFDRIGQYYDDSGNVGENIAMGSTDMRYAVMSMWMCSHEGHRANIMSADWNELGAGVYDEYQTQDFGAGELEEGDPPVRMGVDDGDTFYADWADEAAPATLQIVVGGVEHDMALLYGAADQGIYSVDLDGVAEGACQSWYVYWETKAGTSGTFPEEGSWLAGSDCAPVSDQGDDWTPDQVARGGLFGDVGEDELNDKMLEDVSLTGCASVPGATARWGAIAGAVVALSVLRRRE